MDTNYIAIGDALTNLKRLPDNVIDCVVTSPPYFGLRDYGIAGQIGLEETPAQYIKKLVMVFREVRRVLKDSGTLWLNLGDTYSSGSSSPLPIHALGSNAGVARNLIENLKPKQLLMIPARVALALQADGWWLRSDVIWHKPNGMPESVTDRPTRSHEHIFLLTQSEHYFYDADAIREPHTTGKRRDKWEGRVYDSKGDPTGDNRENGNTRAYIMHPHGRNKRDVWTIATTPFTEAHFATFPMALAETCIEAGCPPGGIVLDPFGGAGTTALAAKKLGRSYILIELSMRYAGIAQRRIQTFDPYQANVFEDGTKQLSLFEGMVG
jgi:DNA modification methylase